MTFGWLSDAATWASARNRRRNPASSASARCRTFTADPPAQPDVVGDVDATARARTDRREQAVPAGEDTAGEVGDATDRHRVTVPAGPARTAAPQRRRWPMRDGCGVSLGRDGRHPGAPSDPIVAGPRAATAPRRKAFQHPGRIAIVVVALLVVVNLLVVAVEHRPRPNPGGAEPLPADRRVGEPRARLDRRPGRDHHRRPRRQPHRRAARDRTTARTSRSPRTSSTGSSSSARSTFRPGPGQGHRPASSAGQNDVVVLYWSQTRIGGRRGTRPATPGASTSRR